MLAQPKLPLFRALLLSITLLCTHQHAKAASYSGTYTSPVTVTENSVCTASTNFQGGLTILPGVTLSVNLGIPTPYSVVATDLTVQGTFYISNSAQITSFLGITLVDGGHIELIDGSFNHNSSGSFQIINSGEITINSGGTALNQTGANINIIGSGSKIHVNGGELKHDKNFQMNFQSGGMLHVSSGTVYNNFTGTNPGATLNFNSGGILQMDGGTIRNDGTYDATLSMSTAAQIILMHHGLKSVESTLMIRPIHPRA